MISGELILLVDDIPDHFGAYQRALREEGFRVHAVSSGTEALHEVKASSPDLAVVDVRLPDMTGWDLCRAIKRDPNAGNPPILMLTADVSKTCADDSARSGCNAWLAHPARADDLVRAVRQVLALDVDAPASSDHALLGVTNCPACAADSIKATLRVSMIQYYCCAACGLCWRVDTQPN
jgi:CheY-like chemotaxis protein